MTHIGAIVVHNKEEPHIVCVADSMGSNERARFKQDNYQKIVRTNNTINMITGDNGPLASNVQQQIHKASPQTLAEVIEATTQIAVKEHEQIPARTHFLLAGLDEQGPAVYVIKVESKANEQGKVVVQNERPFRTHYYFDGSGSIHSNNSAKYANHFVADMAVDTTPDTLTAIHWLAKFAAEDTGVNDKLQYGIVTPNKTVTLYHPEVAFMNDELANEYIASMTGLRTAQEQESVSQRIKDGRKKDDAHAVLNRLFTNLSIDLSNSVSASTTMHHFVNGWVRGKVSQEELEEQKEYLLGARERVIKATTTFLSADPRKMMKYNQEVARREAETHKRLISYLSSNK